MLSEHFPPAWKSQAPGGKLAVLLLPPPHESRSSEQAHSAIKKMRTLFIGQASRWILLPRRVGADQGSERTAWPLHYATAAMRWSSHGQRGDLAAPTGSNGELNRGRLRHRGGGDGERSSRIS